MCCDKKCLKYTNLTYVAFFILICIGQILLGAYLILNMYDLIRPETIGELNIIIPPLVLCICGIILISMIVLGCCGFLKEVSCCVNLYSTFLIILSVAQILMGVYALMIFTDNNTELRSQIKRDITYSFQNYKNNPYDLKRIQARLHCCGVDSPEDWVTFVLHGTCCDDNFVTECNKNSTFLHKSGCVQKTLAFITLWNTIVGYVSIASGIFEVLVAAMSFALGCGPYKDSYKV